MFFSVIRTIMAGGSVDIVTVAAQVLAIIFVIICILPLHELAHGWIAYKLGDPTAKLERRLTLNPLASVDPIGTVWLFLFGFGWARPVPVDPRYFRKPKRDMAIVALAGPVSNLLAALVGALLLNVMVVIAGHNGVNSVLYFVYTLLSYYVMVNVTLAAFNLLPIPPLDGSRILGAFLSDRALETYYRYQNVFVMVLFVLMFSGAFSGPLYAIESAMSKGIFWIAALPFKLFGLSF
ncbi:site-2 protease family protein [Acutalibacter sp.]|jgi:Zn-dependent protease|uniref:site-2 protease family protein n=1 Tax=Acutalibacter sp. TaxID=1918636 RepID=UPI0025C53DAD|nr:site-2 protease family protein [Acutalibacter sp.]